VYLTVQNNNMGRIVRVNISLDNSHSLDDFPVDLYSGLTSGDTTNLVYANIVSTDIPLDLMFEDSDLNVSNDPNNPFVPHCYMRISSDGCYDEIIKLEVPKEDCEMCVDFQEIIPEPTPTDVSNPTPTPTPIVVSDTDVFLNDSGSPTSIYSYNPNTTVLTYLYDSTNGSSDIANTSNKLWVYSGGNGSLLEYDITLSPFSQTYNRTITSVYLNAGLCAIDDTTLININGSNVYEIDITTNVASPTLKWSTISGRTVAGDYMYTTTNKLIITNNSSSGAHITQYDYTTGTVEVDLDITATIPQPYGVFEYGSEIYIVNSNGKVYQIMGSSPYTLTLVDDIAITVYGASQIPSKITEDFTPVTESTPTPTPTATDPEPTPTPTSTPTSTPTPTPSPTSGDCQEYQLWMTGQGETQSQWEWTECGGSVTTWTNVGANFRVVCSETTPVLNYGDGFNTLNGDCNNYTVTRCNDGLQVTVAKNLSCLTGTPPTYSIGDIIQFKQYSVASGNCSGESFCGTITATDSNQPYDYVVSRAATIDSCGDLTHCQQ
jgi:cell division septation protein DedD